MIHVTIARKSGSSLKRQHWLSLQYPPVSSSSTSSAGRQPRKREDRPTIYLSSGITDWGLGKAVGKALEEKGFDVLSKDEAPLGVPWDRAFSKLVDRADLFIPLISGEISSWTIREIEAARQRKLPIIPVLCGAEARLPDSLKEFQTISVESGASLDQVAPGIAEQIAGAVDLPSRK